MLEQYLQELRRELSRRFPEDDVQARLAEVEAHLSEGVESRMELGLERDVAERETVEAFGLSHQVGRAMRPETAFVAVRLRWLGVAYATLVVAYLFLDVLRARVPFLAPLLWGTLLVGMGGIGISAFRSRRAVILPLAATAAAGAAMLWAFFGLWWLNLWNYGGMGFLPRSSVSSVLNESPARSTSVDHAIERRINRVAIRRAQADPVGNWLSQAGSGLGLGAGLGGVAIVIDILGAGLGAWAIRRRRRGVA